MTPDQYCQDKAAKSGSSFYYSFIFLAPPQRQAITALYAFCREVDDVVDECSDPNLAATKLAWWRTEIAALFDGTPTHPVTQALQTAVQGFNLPQEHFLEIIDGMAMDLEQFSYQSFKDLSLYCYRVAAVVGLMAAEIFGYQNRQTLKYAHNLGMAFQLTNILRDVAEDAARGRIYIPQDELQRFGVAQDDILNHQMSDNAAKLMAFQAERAREYYTKAFALLPEEDRYRQRSGVIMAAIYQATLDEIEKDNYRVLDQRISLTPLRKFWIAWRSARHEKRRYRQWRRKH
ncbi:squalene synthase HpnD [Candidatus Tenderia electrophaga]|jgi:phytoene synthase|uniref:Squalene synthase HpnD n=1 Tax=Candidatus Tenderia electrophaga TaxID=1748243 RepID=A0A0S2TDG2_9GAMM|nr:squalene synthase HpnD [Candidatus Tenderia electrophaga]